MRQRMAGADKIFCVGGVQAVVALALGIKNVAAVEMIIGPGNAYVVEAKRQLSGSIGVDLLAPAEHSPNAPAILLTNVEKRTRETMAEIERQRGVLSNAPIASNAWANYDQVMIADSYKKLAQIAAKIASERVQVMTNYCALLLGHPNTVNYGDKVTDTNHRLPKQKNARFTGGLWVGKFIKTGTYQRVLTDEARVMIGEYCLRLCATERFAGHKEQADRRVHHCDRKQAA